MTGRWYYNEIDPHAAEWLRELIAQGSLPDGFVDERSIADVAPSDLDGFDQCHFFAGIGALARAVVDAGYGHVRGLWTGSCPCQPFSGSGNRQGLSDERHLWPEFFRLIDARRPTFVFGEQVASALSVGHVNRKVGQEPAAFEDWSWIDHVFDDLEGSHYTCGADIGTASSVGGFHIRQRLYFVAHTDDARPQGRDVGGNRADQLPAGQGGLDGRLEDAHGAVAQQSARQGARPDQAQGTGPHGEPHGRDPSGRLAHPLDDEQRQGGRSDGQGAAGSEPRTEPSGRRAAGQLVGGEWSNSHQGRWDDPDWLFCRDGRWRPIEPGLEPLVDGFTPGMGPSGDPSASYCRRTSEARVMRLRGYGNSVVLPQATLFIETAMETIQWTS